MRCGTNSLGFVIRWKTYTQGSNKAGRTTIAEPSGRSYAYKRALKQNFTRLKLDRPYNTRQRASLGRWKERDHDLWKATREK
jgi:hypothetical protein